MVFVDNSIKAVEFVAMIGFLVMGLSHIVQPKMWVDYFSSLHEQGNNGVVTSIVALQFWPAVIIVSAHQVWSGPGLILTLYGWLLLGKCIIALLVPAFGWRGLSMAQQNGKRGFVVAGLALVGIAATSGAALYL